MIISTQKGIRLVAIQLDVLKKLQREIKGKGISIDMGNRPPNENLEHVVTREIHFQPNERSMLSKDLGVEIKADKCQGRRM